MTSPYQMPSNRSRALNPVLKAGQSTLGHRYHGVVTVVVDCMCLRDFVPRGLDADHLYRWIDTSVLSRMARGATLTVVHK